MKGKVNDKELNKVVRFAADDFLDAFAVAVQ